MHDATLVDYVYIRRTWLQLYDVDLELVQRYTIDDHRVTFLIQM